MVNHPSIPSIAPEEPSPAVAAAAFRMALPRQEPQELGPARGPATEKDGTTWGRGGEVEDKTNANHTPYIHHYIYLYMLYTTIYISYIYIYISYLFISIYIYIIICSSKWNISINIPKYRIYIYDWHSRLTFRVDIFGMCTLYGICLHVITFLGGNLADRIHGILVN